MRYSFLIITLVWNLLSALPAAAQSNIAEVKLQQSNWQQKVNHTISVTLDVNRKFLLAEETFEYFNNSPDTLSEIWLHIWPNAFKNNQTAYGKEAVVLGNKKYYQADKSERGFLDSLNFTVDGVAANFKIHPVNIDIMVLILPTKLLPGKKVSVHTPFRVKIPFLFSRQGFNGNLLSLTQWYPKPAVYDANGWNCFPYVDQGEYYSEYGSYDVKITLPAHYRVAATGVLQNAEELEWLNKIAEGREDSLLRKGIKTLHYKQEDVPDFAWFTNPDFKIAKGIEKIGKDSVFTYAFYTEEKGKGLRGRLSGGANGQEIVNSIGTALQYYSKRVGPYPYQYCTVVVGPLQGAGGMEYPMITICGDASSGTVIHEVGHNWFQCILGSNERAHPWMDESINTFYHTQADSKENKEFSPGDKLNVSGFYSQMRFGHDLGNFQSGLLHSSAYQKLNYGTIVYAGNPQNFMYLQEYLGASLFDSCMQEYFKIWKYKHPLPKDIQQVFEIVSRRDLAWFFSDLMGQNLPDYKLKSVRKNKEGLSVTVKNKSAYSLPVKLGWLEGSKRREIWLSGKDTTVKIKGAISDVSINPTGALSESNIANNDARAKGIFKTWGHLSVGFPKIYHRFENRVWFLPIFYTWNMYDGYMPGIVLSNMNSPRRQWEWWATPMYGIKSKTYTGYSGIRRNIFYKSGPIALSEIEAKYSRFSIAPDTDSSRTAYNRFSIGANIFLKRTHPFIQDNFEIEYTKVRLDRSSYRGNIEGIDTLLNYNNDLQNDILKIAFVRNVYKKLRPRMYKLQIEGGKNNKPGAYDKNSLEIPPFKFIKITAIADMFFAYSAKSKNNAGFKLKGYAEAFVYQESATYWTSGAYNPVVSGVNGSNDYAYRQPMNGRSENFNSGNLFSQQLLTNGNGVRMLPNITANKWVAGVNMQSHIVPKIPLQVYFDIAATGSTQKAFNSYWVGGAAIALNSGSITNFELNVPLVYSSNFNNLVKGFEWYQLIAFRVNLGIWNPYKFARGIYQ